MLPAAIISAWPAWPHAVHRKIACVRAIALIDVPTHRAGAAGVARIYRDHHDAGQLCLVGDERPQLLEGPGMQHHALLQAPNCYPRANMRQILDGNMACGAFGRGHYLLAQDMIGVCGEALFLAREFLQKTPRALGAFLLQALAQPLMAIAHVLEMVRSVDRAVAIHGQMCDPHVNAQELARVCGRRFLDITRRKQIKLAVAVDQVRLAVLRGHQLPRPLAAGHGHTDAAPQHLQRDGPIPQAVADNLVVVGNRAMRLKEPLPLRVQLIGIGHLADRANGQVGRHAELFPHATIDKFLDVVLPKCLLLPRFAADEITGWLTRSSVATSWRCWSASGRRATRAINFIPLVYHKFH